MDSELIARARSGDGAAFGDLVEPYRNELQLHCYRMLGSVQDAEDALQETLTSAWVGMRGFRGDASVRTWLYRIATNRCLNALRSARRRPSTGAGPVPGLDPPEPTRLGEVVWLEPYPDVLLEGFATSTPGPEARYETTEAISLAFVTAVQLLPPRQRAVLILRDVLGYAAREVADMLESSEPSVTSALARARATLKRQMSASADHQPAPSPNSAAEQKLIAQFTHALAVGDVESLVGLLTDDVWLTMPPLPLQYQGRELAARFHATVTFRQGRTYRLVPTRANGQPAFGMYVYDQAAPVLHANGLMVLTLAGGKISAMTRFDNSVLPRFGLPRTLPS
jgi:RNA polymerase sigma-70 factor (TIGR02960 family)